MGGDPTPRWMCWFLSMVFFLYIVYELLVGLAEATNKETDKALKAKIGNAQVMTVVSLCTYPVVYLFPMMGINAAHAIVGIQIGYCASDIISKCGVGLLIYQISYAKSTLERAGMVKTYSADLEGANDAFAKAKALKDQVQSEFKQAKKSTSINLVLARSPPPSEERFVSLRRTASQPRWKGYFLVSWAFGIHAKCSKDVLLP